MNGDLLWLGLSLAATALFWIPYLLDRVRVRGVMGTLENPSADLAPQSPWAQRAKQAHSNAVENLVVFAPAVLVAHLLAPGDSLVMEASVLYFFSRLVHYVVYSAGLIGIRTVAFTGGWVATVLVILRVLQLA